MQRRTRLLAAALAATTALGLVPTAPASAANPPARHHWFGPNGQLNTTEDFTPPGATPVIGEFDVEQGDDIIWYTPGAGGDAFWSSNGDGTYTASALSISGTYTPYVGSFAGDGKGQDVLWYSTTGASQLWDFREPEDGPTLKTSLPGVTGTGQIIVGDFTGDGADDVIRYRPGAQPEQWWDFDRPTANPNPVITNRTLSVGGTYTPIVGRFDQDASVGDNGQDIFWYAPGSGADSLWDFQANASVTTRSMTVNGTFKPLVGHWMSSPHEQILWYAPGSAGDALWAFEGNDTLTKKSLTINGTYTPYTCECIGSGLGDRSDILFHGVGNAPDAIWSNNGPTFAPVSHSYPGTAIRGSKLALPHVDGFDQYPLAYG